ncbi:OefA [Coccidioides immitis H538.4]|uniref:OefA n=1 Tax=Coccidioides immitis H538.4 TaxID=396776 RepID=A0A0J8RSS4_COCIT|nr:OefA [Coccidioides immitis H538.4]
MNTAAPSKSGHRDGEVNGVDPNAMVTDSNDDAKPKIPDDLPRPNLNGDMQQTSFLFDWFNLFWDVFWAQRKKGKSTDAMQYLQHTQNILRLRDHQQNQLYRHSQMMPSQFNMRMGNGMMRTNMQKSLMQANAPNMTPQQLAQLQQNKAQLMHHQMQREHSDIEMNGHRPQSPSSVENAPSPSKRPRLDGTQVNGQQMTPNGRAQSQGMPAMNNQGMPNGLMNPGVMPNQGEVMPLHDGQGMLPMQDYYAPNGQMAQMRPGMQTPGGQAGVEPVHLQIQNEQMKRGTPKLPQTGLPGSPNVGDNMGQSRGSPASMNFAGGQMPPEMGGAAFFSMKPEGVVGPNGMRPPSSNPAFSGPQMTQPMDAMARPQPPGTANRMPAGNWQQTPQGQPMIPQPQQPGQGPPGGTPQERNAMPPPQAPAAGAGGRAQPPSPQPGTVAPPTPQQANKPAPKTKKDTKDNARKRPTKAKGPANTGNTAATPSSEAEPPPTPTPSTPITPVHPNSFNKPGPNANAPQPTPAPQAIGQQPPPQPAQQAPQAQPPQPQQQQSQPQQQPQQDPNLPFGDMNLPDTHNYNLDFTTLDNPDILENFDFDTFLNTDDPTTFAFEPGLSYPADGVEAGAGETM